MLLNRDRTHITLLARQASNHFSNNVDRKLLLAHGLIRAYNIFFPALLISVFGQCGKALTLEVGNQGLKTGCAKMTSPNPANQLTGCSSCIIACNLVLVWN